MLLNEEVGHGVDEGGSDVITLGEVGVEVAELGRSQQGEPEGRDGDGDAFPGGGEVHVHPVEDGLETGDALGVVHVLCEVGVEGVGHAGGLLRGLHEVDALRLRVAGHAPEVGADQDEGRDVRCAPGQGDCIDDAEGVEGLCYCHIGLVLMGYSDM